MVQNSQLSEAQIREIIGRVVRDSSFAQELAATKTADDFLAVLDNYGYTPSEEQAQEIRDNLDALQTAAETLDFGAGVGHTHGIEEARRTP